MKNYPEIRLRRLRKNSYIRKIFDQPMPDAGKFIYPVFLTEGKNKKEAISAMPGQFRYSIDSLCRKIEPIVKTGIGGVLLFGIPGSDGKDPSGSMAYNDDGVVQHGIRVLKKEFGNFPVFTDVCLCAYTDHGHCGFLDDSGNVDNDRTLEQLARIALSHARAGADCVAPSAMMDGQIGVIREILDSNNLSDTLLMSYSTKFASSMYGPFREAEKSSPGKGDRKGYQASFRDRKQALRESFLDEDEGADILMVKPALFYLDIVSSLKQRTELPLAVYNVSGEYSMLAASAEKGWGNLRDMVRESIFAMKRAGADIIISYWADRYDDFLRD